jgi:hypothetical protein
MEPFKNPSTLRNIVGTYPDAAHIADAVMSGGQFAKQAIATQWLSEGVPYAFKDAPLIYESVRSWLSIRLNVEPKSINITGSGRLGQSLSPKQLGKKFGSHSDLDFFIVSESLFSRIREDFNQWYADYYSGVVKPKNEREASFWKENAVRGERSIGRGFIDANIIPNLDPYSQTRQISQTMWLLSERLKVTTGAPKVKDMSIRCYKTWDEFITQTFLNVEYSLPQVK